MESVKNLRSIAHKDDYKKISSFMNKEYLLDELAKGSKTVVSTHYRLMVDDKPVYYRVRISMRTSDRNHILVAVENVNDNITKDLLYQSQLKRDRDIIEVLSAEYSSVYCVNLAANSFELCKIDEEISSSLDMTQLSSLSFTEIYSFFVDRMVYEPDRQKMIEAGSIYNILLKLRDKNSFSTVYRSPVNGVIQYCEMKIVKIGSDELPTEVVIGFADRSVEKTSEIEREMNVQKILNLSRNLEAVVEIDLNDGTYYFRTVADLAADQPVSPFVREGKVSEEEINEYIFSEIYKEDRAQFQSFRSIEDLYNKLREYPSFEIKYRALSGNTYIWKCMKGVLNTQQSDSLSAIIGFFDIDQEQRLEQKQAAEVKKLSYDAYFDKLTGTRNRNAYVAEELEINQKMLSGKADDFAVAVFDINCLKKTNDRRGHDKGDELIKTAAGLICDTFKHSPVFRIGGDEFVVLLKGEDFISRNVLIDSIIRKAKAFDPQMPIFAVGAADRILSDHSVSDIFARADEAMYLDKVASKE